MKNNSLSIDEAVKLYEENKHLIGTLVEKVDGSIHLVENILIVPEDSSYQFLFDEATQPSNKNINLNSDKSFSVIAVVRHLLPSGELDYSYQVVTGVYLT